MAGADNGYRPESSRFFPSRWLQTASCDHLVILADSRAAKGIQSPGPENKSPDFSKLIVRHGDDIIP